VPGRGGIPSANQHRVNPGLTWTAHLVILLAVPVTSAVLVALLRQWAAWSRAARCCLGGALAVNELVWYGYRLHEEGFRFPEALPLQLCDLTLWLTVIAALTLNPGVYEIAYFCGLGGSSMALLMPDLWAPFPSYPTIYFFVSHGLVVITRLTLTWSHLVRPRCGSVWRAFAVLNIYTAAIAVFDARFNTNYMYLCEKPPITSVLGPLMCSSRISLRWPYFGCCGCRLDRIREYCRKGAYRSSNRCARMMYSDTGTATCRGAAASGSLGRTSRRHAGTNPLSWRRRGRRRRRGCGLAIQPGRPFCLRLQRWSDGGGENGPSDG
jgi:hypothetical integral membrane protein (TIGR02206 family)